MVAFVFVASDSKKGTLVGVTLSLVHTLYELKVEASQGTKKFARYDRLVHFERCKNISDAHQRKADLERCGKDALHKVIESKNPTWSDLGSNWFPIPQQAVVEVSETVVTH